MFFNKQQSEAEHSPPAPTCALPPPNAKLELNTPKERSRSLIDRSANMIGDLWSDGDVQIDGHLCGNINCAQLIVGREAAVTGVIIAQEAVIRGKMTGLIRARRVLLQASARVESEIIYQTLSVDEGAKFEGVARPQANPLAEESALAPSAEQRPLTATAEVGLAAAHASGLGREARVRSDASPEPPQRSIERSAAAGL
jgi:cytoskeletal protein CcmA (bactofilin family)